jgi:hypothetical protein
MYNPDIGGDFAHIRVLVNQRTIDTQNSRSAGGKVAFQPRHFHFLKSLPEHRHHRLHPTEADYLPRHWRSRSFIETGFQLSISGSRHSRVSVVPLQS